MLQAGFLTGMKPSLLLGEDELSLAGCLGRLPGCASYILPLLRIGRTATGSGQHIFLDMWGSYCGSSMLPKPSQ